MTAAIDLFQQYPLITLAYWFVLAGAAMDAYERREGMDDE